MRFGFDKNISNKISKKGQFFALFVFLFFYSQASFATQLVERFHDWSFFKFDRSDMIVCYIASTPIKKNDNLYSRGEPYLTITNIANDADEVVASSGFYYKENSDVEISFGSKKFYFFPYITLSWANDRNEDLDVIKEMQKNDEMTVSGASASGRVASDTYSLIGFPQAYKQMKETCKN